MFKSVLEEDLAAIFKLPVNMDIGQARNQCELYYHFTEQIDVTVSPNNTMTFRGAIMVEVLYPVDEAAFGQLTAACHAYENFYDKDRIKSSNKLEIPISMEQGHVTLGKELTFTYEFDHDKVRETIQSIKWS